MRATMLWIVILSASCADAIDIGPDASALDPGRYRLDEQRLIIRDSDPFCYATVCCVSSGDFLYRCETDPNWSGGNAICAGNCGTDRPRCGDGWCTVIDGHDAPDGITKVVCKCTKWNNA